MSKNKTTYEEFWNEVARRAPIPISKVDALEKHITELEQRLAAAESLNQKLIQFFITGMREIWEGHDWEGGEVQDLAEELGLIQRASDEDQDEEFGVFYDYSPEIKNLMDKANAPGVGDD